MAMESTPGLVLSSVRQKRASDKYSSAEEQEMIVCQILHRSPEYLWFAPILKRVDRFDRSGYRLETGIHHN